MINRALLRIKVAQVLYACFAKENFDLTAAENELQLSIQKSYDLYHYLLLLIAESRRYTEVKADSSISQMATSLISPTTLFTASIFLK